MRASHFLAFCSIALAACSGGFGQPTPGVGSQQSAAIGFNSQTKSKLRVKPAVLDLLGTGAANLLSTTLSEAGYSGKITRKSTCKGVAAVKPTVGRGPKQSIKVNGSKAGTCTVTFADAKGNTAVLNVGVTTTSIALQGPLPKKAASVTITLESVDGKRPQKDIKATATRALKHCADGCSVAGPQSPPGNDVYGATIANGKGTILADSEPASAAIRAAQANVVAIAFASATPTPTASPTTSPIVYACTSGCPSPAPANPEIDLYSTSPSASGYTATFTATQQNWTTSPYDEPFTYAFSAIKGQADNCPGSGAAGYTISPASGTVGTSFTVTATNAAMSGECLMTLTGGGSQTLGVTLTFTSSGIGINRRDEHR